MLRASAGQTTIMRNRNQSSIIFHHCAVAPLPSLREKMIAVISLNGASPLKIHSSNAAGQQNAFNLFIAMLFSNLFTQLI